MHQMRVLLQIEELQHEVDVRQYDMDEACFNRAGGQQGIPSTLSLEVRRQERILDG